MLKFLSGLTALLFTFAVTQCIPSSSTTTADPSSSINYPTVDASCGSTIASIKRYLLDAGYNENATAAIMGNLMEESGSNISIYDIGDDTVTVNDSFIAYDLTKNDASGKTFTGGFGIAQWTWWSRVKGLQEYAQQYANNIVASETAQFGYLVKELSKDNSPSYLNTLSLEEATWVVRRGYEGPKSVSCTNSDPDDYILTCQYSCEAGSTTCKETGKTCANGNKQVKSWNSVNTKKAETSYSELVSNKQNYSAAWGTLQATIKHAQTAKSTSIEKCSDTSTTTSDDPSTPTSSSADSSTSTSSGALGATSSDGFYRQDSFKTTVWRKDNSTIEKSGCSLIAMANAMKVLGMTTESAPTGIASYTKTVISGASQTGWGNATMSIERIISNYGLSQETLWSEYSTSTTKKIEAIRRALASGKAVVAGGERKHSNPESTTCKDKNSGVCAFSYDGHFIAIVGITADDQLVVANPSMGNGHGNVYPADAVLKNSNKAISVSKKTNSSNRNNNNRYDQLQ